MVGPRNSLRCLDPKTGQQKWALAFATPPVAAYAEGGGINTLLAHPLPQPVNPRNSRQGALKARLPSTPTPSASGVLTSGSGRWLESANR